ncbi:TPA: hypothetical protein U6315_002199 [Legionella pneumophila]|uniref:Uncharacterized protein n=1 Tax=Legionella moravica TaxID=39962 RepID=A0A378JSQ0_9GAMM|nr:hypothetical protein [Legionella moravica]STX61673.1 Uncharacterised protein [Legionella moravica]HEN5529745.1 hypothetical protein [Legionella pneumophila]
MQSQIDKQGHSSIRTDFLMMRTSYMEINYTYILFDVAVNIVFMEKT